MPPSRQETVKIILWSFWVTTPGPKARAWAYGILHQAGVDAEADPAYAAGLLMRAESRLTRDHADALVRSML